MKPLEYFVELVGSVSFILAFALLAECQAGFAAPASAGFRRGPCDHTFTETYTGGETMAVSRVNGSLYLPVILERNQRGIQNCNNSDMERKSTKIPVIWREINAEYKIVTTEY